MPPPKGDLNMYYFFAQFYPEPTGGYSVYFPDFPGCNTCGDDLNEAMTMATEALTGFLELSLEDGETIPQPLDHDSAKAQSLAAYEQMGIPAQDGTLYMLVPADPKAEPYVRLNISMKPRLVAQIDRRAKEEGLTRSGLLAAAARQYISQYSPV